MQHIVIFFLNLMIDLMIKLFISQVQLNIRLRFCVVDDHLEQLSPVTNTDHTGILYLLQEQFFCPWT